MTARPGSITNQPAAGALTGTEAFIVDQEQGAVVAATAMVVGQSYRIVSLGTTNWQTAGAPTGAVVGTMFGCEAVGTGTGTAQLVDGRRLAASALATWILQTAGSQFQPLDADLTALAAVAGQTAYGRAFLALVDQAGARDYIGIGPDDSLTIDDLTVSGLLQANHIHGNLAGSVYAHVKNVSGGPLAAGTPLRITDTVGDTTTLEVVAADAASGATMPALFVLSEALANNGEGHATIAGEITGQNTAGLTPGAPLWVPVGGGVVTATRPAANAQQVATVGRAHANTGSIHVLPWPVEDPRVSQADAEAGSSTVFSLWSPERWRQAAEAWWLTVSTTVGRAVVAAADAAAARGAIGAASTATFSTSAAGLVPASGGGTATFLRADATFAAPPGGTPGGTTGQAQYNAAGSFAGIPNSSVDGTTGAVTLARLVASANGAASVSAVSLTGTWFTGGTTSNTYPALLISPSGETLPSLNTAGTGVLVNGPSSFNGDLLWVGRAGSRIFNVTHTTIRLFNFYSLTYPSGWLVLNDYDGQPALSLNRISTDTGVNITNTHLSWGPNYFTSRLQLHRDADDTLGQRRGTNPQRSHLYNTFTSDTNFERAKQHWSNNVFLLGTEKGSAGGTARAMELQTDAVTRVQISRDGVIRYAQPDPVAVNTTATLTVANLQAGIITTTTAAAVDMTLPTGTGVAGGFAVNANNLTMEWSVINTGGNAATILVATDHTIVGSAVVAAGTSGRFATRQTATNTFVTYRIS